MSWIRSGLLLGLLVTSFAIACATPASSPRGPVRNPNLITQEELAAAPQTNLYDAIRQIRPAFLRSRGQSTFEPGASSFPVIFMDGQRFGEFQVLRTMSTEQVKEIRFLSASDATTKFGTGYGAGIIEVVTR